MNRREFFVFAVQTFGVFTIIFITASFLGFLPEEISFKKDTQKVSEYNKSSEEQGVTQIVSGDSFVNRPTHIYIPKIGVDSVILQPDSQDVATLDAALQEGAVHYPGSGVASQGNMFLFGHSTNWKVVQNKAYKTFNGVEELLPGDEIIVDTDGVETVYIVDSVTLVDENDALVEIGGIDRKLTISTCNSFGEKQERWVVEAYPQG